MKKIISIALLIFICNLQSKAQNKGSVTFETQYQYTISIGEQTTSQQRKNAEVTLVFTPSPAKMILQENGRKMVMEANGLEKSEVANGVDYRMKLDRSDISIHHVIYDDGNYKLVIYSNKIDDHTFKKITYLTSFPVENVLSLMK